MKKKRYVKPELTKLGDLNEFVKGTSSANNAIDVYSQTPSNLCDCNGQPAQGNNLGAGFPYCGYPTVDGYFVGREKSQGANAGQCLGL